MEQLIRVHSTAHIKTLQNLVAQLPKPFLEILPDPTGIAVTHLDASGQEYRSVFSGRPTRARTNNRGDIYLDADKVQGLPSLRALFLHELAHATQFVLRRPLRFGGWTRLHDLAFWDEKTRSLLQVVADRSGLKQVIPQDRLAYRPAALRLMNFFADADAHAFMLDHGILSLDAYGEALKDYVAAIGTPALRAGSEPLDELWLKHQRIPQRQVRIAAQSWPVMMEWLTVVGGRWARVGTLVGRPEAAATLEAYVGPDRDAIRDHLGAFADDGVFDQRWRQLAGAGDDIESLWEIVLRLASDAVGLVRSKCDG